MVNRWSGLQAKFFVAFICATVSVTLVMAFFVNWNFDRGFRQYLDQQTLERATPFAKGLGNYYEKKGSWSGLKKKNRAWRRLLLEIWRDRDQQFFDHFDPDDSPPDHADKPRSEAEDLHGREAQRARSPIHRGRLGQLSRSRLYDADKNLVVGFRGELKNELLKPVLVGRTVVGYIGLKPINLKTDRLGSEFRQQQLQSLVWVVASVLLISALLAWLLGRHLMAPIKATTQAVRDLAAGDYTRRITIDTSDELALLARDFNLLAATLQDNEKSRQQWIADISHELRTPLAVLQGEIEALIDGVRQLDEQQLKSLHSEVLALSQLVNDLYQLALSDVGALDYRFELIAAKELLHESTDLYAHRIAQANLGFNVIGLEALSVNVRVDEKRIAQLFNNLLENSLRYTDSGGSINLSVAVLGDELEILLEDSSPGVPSDALDMIFDRLYRVDQSRSREFGGSGLGLALCSNIVAAHGGSIGASHSSLGGVAIRIVFPCVTDA